MSQLKIYSDFVLLHSEHKNIDNREKKTELNTEGTVMMSSCHSFLYNECLTLQ